MIRRTAWAVVFVGLSGACGGDSSGPPPPPGPSPHHLAFSRQPGTALAGSTLSPAIIVEVRDSIDRRISSATNAVTIAIAANPGAGTLAGTTTRQAVSGIATFNDLKLNQRGRGYTLAASAGVLIPDTSGSFNVMAPLLVDALAAGSDHVCGVKFGVATYCWGSGLSGELGNGDSVNQPFPVVVSGGQQLTNLAAGYAATCGITGGGVAYCWGQSLGGKLGDSTYGTRAVPTPVIGGHTFLSPPNQGFFHACGLASGGQAYCWGGNNVGQLGDSTRNGSLQPVAVTGGLTFSTLHSTNFHTCGVTPDHDAYCWGGNTRGQLGDSTNVEQLAPTLVKGGLAFRTIGAGGATTCGLTTTGAAYCWGGVSSDLWVPRAVPGGLTFASLSMGGLFACGLLADGSAYCWGGIPGGGYPAPALISPSLKFTTIAAGFQHACGRTAVGLVYCWGTNPRGQLGDGTTNNSSVPLLVLY